MADPFDGIEKPVPDDDSECASCAFGTRELKAYERGGFGASSGPARYSLLCDLCASTMAGNAEQYPEQYGVQGQAVLQAICYVGNAIIAEIRKAKS